MIQENFQFNLPTTILFGEGKINEVGRIVSQYGNKVLMVTPHWIEAQEHVFKKIEKLVSEMNIELILYDKVSPNPTLSIINGGVKLAKEENINVILGVGGGSAIDTAKAIAVGATHPGSVWDYLFFKEIQPTNKTLPIVAVTTTSGTGSHVTKASVFTNENTDSKSAIGSPHIFPKVGIVDPELMYSLPPKLTASTGFDAFTHAFESYININGNVFIDHLALEAITNVVKYLPSLMKDGTNYLARRKLAYADTLAGITIANVGTTLPHAIGQPISGHFPHVSHGEALAVVYPEFMDFTYDSSIKKFAHVARIFNPKLNEKPDDEAAYSSPNEVRKFLKKIGMYISLKKLNVTEDKWGDIINDSLKFPDLFANPKVPTKENLAEMLKKMNKI